VWRWVAHILRQIFHLDALTVGDYTRTLDRRLELTDFPGHD
jgi:hypothetical protein